MVALPWRDGAGLEVALMPEPHSLIHGEAPLRWRSLPRFPPFSVLSINVIPSILAVLFVLAAEVVEGGTRCKDRMGILVVLTAKSKVPKFLFLFAMVV
jgi:hypothetical protein